MMSINDFGFHDSTITSFVFDGADLKMVVEHVGDPFDDNDESQHNLVLTFKNVISININDISASKLESPNPEGIILRFEAKNQRAKFFVEWIDYKSKKSSYADYEFDYKLLEIDEL